MVGSAQKLMAEIEEKQFLQEEGHCHQLKEKVCAKQRKSTTSYYHQ